MVLLHSNGDLEGRIDTFALKTWRWMNMQHGDMEGASDIMKIMKEDLN